MKKILIMLAVATVPASSGCNCCGLAACPCNPCNWFTRGAYCGPTPTYAPMVAAPAPCAPMASTVLPQYPMQTAGPMVAPMAAPAMVGAPMIADPAAQPLVYSEPGCGYVEPGCGYMGNTVGYGPMIPMGNAGCCDVGNFEGAVMSAPVEPYTDPRPAADESM